MPNPAGGGGGGGDRWSWAPGSSTSSLLDDAFPNTPSSSSSSVSHLPPTLPLDHFLAESRSLTVLSMPEPAPVPFEVPLSQTPLTLFDFSLPPLHRMTQHELALSQLPSPRHQAHYLDQMNHYHRITLANTRVARLMERNLPPMTLLSKDPKHVARSNAARMTLRTNAWLLYGPQVAMLRNAQTKLRGLTAMQGPLRPWQEVPENAARRSHLDRNPQRTQRGKRIHKRLPRSPQNSAAGSLART